MTKNRALVNAKHIEDLIKTNPHLREFAIPDMTNRILNRSSKSMSITLFLYYSILQRYADFKTSESKLEYRSSSSRNNESVRHLKTKLAGIRQDLKDLKLIVLSRRSDVLHLIGE